MTLVADPEFSVYHTYGVETSWPGLVLSALKPGFYVDWLRSKPLRRSPHRTPPTRELPMRSPSTVIVLSLLWALALVGSSFFLKGLGVGDWVDAGLYVVAGAWASTLVLRRPRSRCA